MRILTIFTGGTIASEYGESDISLSLGKELSLFEGIFDYDKKDIELESLQLMNIFSENMNTCYWSKLFYEIDKAVKSKKYDGIVVTHGSDTLSFTSALGWEIFRSSPVPIVFTAANLPLENPMSNGKENFKKAVMTAASKKGGVFAVWKNDGDDNADALVYRGDNICEADPYYDRFTSFCGENFSQKNQEEEFQVDLSFKNKVLFIKCYPSMDFCAYNMENFTAAAVYLYHSATAPTEGKGSICEFIKKCESEGKKVYLASFKHTDKLYSTSNEMLSHGGIPLYGCSPEKAFAIAVCRENKLTR